MKNDKTTKTFDDIESATKWVIKTHKSTTKNVGAVKENIFKAIRGFESNGDEPKTRKTAYGFSWKETKKKK